MHDNFNFEPYEVPIYVYNCHLCNVEVKSREIFQCIVCEIKLCGMCNHDGFCTDHYEKLTPENKTLFDKLSEEHRLREKTATTSCYIILIIPLIFWIILILGFFSSLNTSVDSVEYFSGNLLFYIITIVLGIVCIVSGFLGYASSKKRRDREYELKKIKLYRDNAKSIKNNER
ncbi:MAG: hypothetical protein ACFFAS_10245 [Promethearchaeota archaeon]